MAQSQPSSPPNLAEGYEQVMVKHVFGPLADRTLELVDLAPGDRVLDVACGTAIVLRRAAPQVGVAGRLAGIDMSPGMIEFATTICASSGINADCRICRVEEMPFADGEFDWVFCQQALQFFSDRALALAEMRRVLTDGGRVVVSVWQSLEQHPYFQALDDAAFEHAGIHMFGDPFSLSDRGELRRLLEAAGFADVTIEPVSFTMRAEEPMRIARMQLTSATVAIPSLQQLGQEQKFDLIDGVMASARATIEAHTIDGMLTIPWHGNVAIARK